VLKEAVKRIGLEINTEKTKNNGTH